jgi:hypothetical protein
MSLTLSIGNTILNVDTLADLATLVTQNGANGTLFELVGAALGAANQPIGQFGYLDKPISLNYNSGAQKWNLDGGIFTFGITGGVVGTLQVYSPGKNLFSYTKSLPALNGFDTAASADNAGNFSTGTDYFVGISLQLSLDVTFGGAGNIGYVGIKGSSEASGQYTFSFFKKVDANTTVEAALIAAFASFTLPLHDRTFTNLAAGDSILHNFKGDLKLGFGLSWGIQTPSVAQNIKAALPVQGLPSANASVKPSAGLDASFLVNFDYTGAFEAYLWKQSDVEGHYHLYRSTTLDLSFGIDVTASLISNASVTVDGGNIATVISGAIPGQTGQVISQIVSQKTSVQSDLDNAAKDVNNTITNILKPIQNVKADLQASIETTDTKSLLFDLTIDLSAAGFDLAAWDNISAGDFVSAIEQQHSGITVDDGSGLEGLHHRKTDLKFSFFNFTGEWSTAHINDYSITYEGNNSFAFTNTAGLDEITNISKSGKEIQFYFTTSITTDTNGNATVQYPDLHVNLKSTNNPAFGVQLANFLALLATGSGPKDAYAQMKSIAGNETSTVELDVVFKPSAYQKLKASPCPLGSAADEAQDRLNYNTFALAVWNANNGVSNIPDFSFLTKLDLNYDLWALARNSEDDQFPPRQGMLPNRKQDTIDSLLSDVFAAISDKFADASDQLTVASIVYALNAGQSFMNLCEDAAGIAVNPTAGAGNPLAAAQQAWKSLNSQISYILSKDVNGSYLLPIACALTELVIEGVQAAYSAPVLPTSQDPGYKLTVQLA